jgi:hypothetical protein
MTENVQAAILRCAGLELTKFARAIVDAFGRDEIGHSLLLAKLQLDQ